MVMKHSTEIQKFIFIQDEFIVTLDTQNSLFLWNIKSGKIMHEIQNEHIQKIKNILNYDVL